MLEDIEKLLNHSWTPTQTLIDKYDDGYAYETASLIDNNVDYNSAYYAIKLQRVPHELPWDSALLLYRIDRAWKYLGFTDDTDNKVIFANLCEILHIDTGTAQKFRQAQTMAERFTVSPILFVMHHNIRNIKEERGILTPNPFIPKDFTELVMNNDSEGLDYYFLSLYRSGFSRYELDEIKKKENNE